MFRITLLFASTVASCILFADDQTEANGRQVSHMVYFSLAEDTPENRTLLMKDIKKYLAGHEGTKHFSVGEIANDMNRSVNDRDFQVTLNLVFASRKAHDTYNVHPRHEEFKTRNKDVIKKVRVFDSYLQSSAAKAK